MSMYSIFVFLAQHSLGLTIAVIAMAFCFVIMRANFNQPESPASYSFKSFKSSSSYVANQANKSNQEVNQANQANQEANQANRMETFNRIKAAKEIKHLSPVVECIESQLAHHNKLNNVKKAIKSFKSSKVFYSNKPKQKPKPKSKPMENSLKYQIQRNNNNKNQSPTQHISDLQNELDMTCYPQYLDGYCSLSENEKLFLSYIKNNNLAAIKNMKVKNINFGECQVLRECVLSDRLDILMYLKDKYLDLLDLNGESGYCLRWSSRKGLYSIVNYLLYQQKYQKIDICFFQFQAIEWSIIYKHKKIAKLLQKFYKDWKLNTKWNVLQDIDSNPNNTQLQNIAHELDEFDIFNLPSIYQQIVEIIINSDEDCSSTADSIEILDKYYKNGCDLCFENNMPWMVATDCANFAILEFLYKRVGVSPVCKGNYLLRTSVELNSIQLLQFAKRIINWQSWKQYVEPNIYQFKQLCKNNKNLCFELENYHHSPTPNNKRNQRKLSPQTPIPWPYENIKEKYGILTRSKIKELVKKGILQEM